MRSALTRAIRSRGFSSTAAAHWSSSHPLSTLPIDIHPEVAQAQSEGRAIVALESTLITHGLPPPHSLSLPIECEDILRAQGVTPATVAIIGGRIKVGLTERQLEMLSEKGFASRSDGGKNLWKVGRRELGAAVVKKMDGGTTVSGTMAVAHLAGIKIFSTGGIGGVHRGAETSFDISSDLISLSDTPVAVVCAGSKSILDIGLTLEYLEAHAVPVASYGTMDWPAFYTPKSGFKAPMQLDNATQVAETIAMTDALGLPSSLLLGVPLPEEFHAAGDALQVAVDQAVAESLENGMSKSGKGVTPWLLERVGQLTKGKAIVSNMALIKNNVRVGGEIALEYAKMKKDSKASTYMPALTSSPAVSSSTTPPSLPPSPSSAKASLVVIGSLAIDLTMTPRNSSPLLTTAPGTVSLSLGGVAGNVSGAAHSMGISDVLLVAPVAQDILGEVARSRMNERGMRSDGLVEFEKGQASTATCGILVDERGELIGGIADMGIATQMSAKPVLEKLRVASPQLVCFDGNITPVLMKYVLEYCSSSQTPTFFEPTSNSNALRLLDALSLSSTPKVPLESPFINYCAPNIHELSVLYQRVRDTDDPRFAAGDWFDFINVSSELLAARLPPWVIQEGISQMAVHLLPIIGTLFVKSGSRGVLVVQRISGAEAIREWQAEGRTKGTAVFASISGPPQAIVMRHYEALELDESSLGTVTGAGDNLAGAILASVVRGLSPKSPTQLDTIVDLAQRAAVATLQSTEAVGDHSVLRGFLPAQA